MTKNFTLRELTASLVASRRHIDNTPASQQVAWLQRLAENILQPLRDAYGKPITVTSGFRCPLLNQAVKGSASSQHLLGQAADIKGFVGRTADYEQLQRENRRLFLLIQQLNLPFDQLIDEKDYSWIHVSFGPRNRRQVLHL